MFSASKDSLWPITYFALLDLLSERPNPDDDLNILDYIANGARLSNSAHNPYVYILLINSTPVHFANVHMLLIFYHFEHTAHIFSKCIYNSCMN